MEPIVGEHMLVGLVVGVAVAVGLLLLLAVAGARR